MDYHVAFRNPKFSVLHGIKAVAEKGASRNRFWAFLRAGVDAGQIQDYRQKLQQCLGTFGASTVPRRVGEAPTQHLN